MKEEKKNRVASEYTQLVSELKPRIKDFQDEIDELKKDFNIDLEISNEDEIETVGGLVFSKINRIPSSNEEFNIDDMINIKVLKANERKILTVQITKIAN